MAQMPHDATDATPTEEYSVRDLLAILFRHGRVLAAVFASIVGVVAAWTVMAPPIYEVEVALLVKEDRRALPMDATQVIVNDVTEEDLNSEIELLRSRALIEGALESDDLVARWRPGGLLARVWGAGLRAAGLDDRPTFAELVVHLQNELRIRPVTKSQIIEVSYRSPDADWAVTFLQQLTERYLEHRIRVHQEPQAEPFFEAQVAAALGRLEAAEGRLEDFVRAAEVSMPMQPQKQAVLDRLAQLEQALAEAVVGVGQHERTVATLSAALADQPLRLASANRQNLDPVTEQVQAGLTALQLRRDEIVQDFGPRNRMARDLEEQIRLAEQRLRVAETQAGDINRTEINPVYQALKTEQINAAAALEGARARLTALEGRVADARRELDDLNHKGFEFERLEREVISSKEAYLLYLKKHEEARISAAMDQRKMVNVSVARSPLPPMRPVAPRKTLNLAFAVLLGGLIALGVALAREYSDHSIPTSQVLERRVGLRHLASIPEVRQA